MGSSEDVLALLRLILETDRIDPKRWRLLQRKAQAVLNAVYVYEPRGPMGLELVGSSERSGVVEAVDSEEIPAPRTKKAPSGLS